MFLYQQIRLLRRYGYLPQGDVTGQDVDNSIKLFREIMGADCSLSDAEVFRIPRCQCPDFPDDNHPYVTEDELNTLSTGSGAWPVGCHPDWPKNHSMVYKVDKTRMPSFLNNVFEDAWSLCAQAYADIGHVLIRDDTGNSYNSLITFEAGSGWIGLAIVPGSGLRCTSRIWAKFAWGYKPSDLLNQWARLIAHEVGHNNRLGHTRGGIMNASITSGIFLPTAWRGDPSFPFLQRFYSGVPVTPEAPLWGIYPIEE